MNRLTDELGQFGWSPNEARCYVALVEQGSMKARQVARETDINQSKIYEPLQSLEENGYARVVDQEPKIYAARNPEFVIKEERRNWEENSKEIRAQLQEAWEVGQVYDPRSDSAWVSKGKSGRRQEIDKAVSNAEESILFYDNRLFRLSRTILRDIEQSANDGIKTRGIAGSQSRNELKNLQSAGAETMLYTDTERTSFYIIDEAKAVLLTSDGENSVVIEDEDITRIITSEFERLAQEADEVTTE